MFAISLAWQKGGVGETTIALGFAVPAARAGYAAAIIDLNPLSSTSRRSPPRLAKLVQPSSWLRLIMVKKAKFVCCRGACILRVKGVRWNYPQKNYSESGRQVRARFARASDRRGRLWGAMCGAIRAGQNITGSWRSNTTNSVNSPNQVISATSIGAWLSVTSLWRRKHPNAQKGKSN